MSPQTQFCAAYFITGAGEAGSKPLVLSRGKQETSSLCLRGNISCTYIGIFPIQMKAYLSNSFLNLHNACGK